jgi:ATP-dependent 26S proteasome regulatory subunit
MARNKTPVVPVVEQDEDANFSDTNLYTWAAGNYFEFKLLCYCIKKVILKIDPKAYEFVANNHGEFEVNLNKRVTILEDGAICFHYKKNNYIWNITQKALDHTIESNGPVEPIKKLVDDYVKNKNPLRKRNMQIKQQDNSFYGIFKPVPKTKFADVIIDEKMKQDIYDNTVFHMKNLNQNNGIIMYGQQGSGKSMVCQAIIAEAIANGFSTCCVTTAIEFSLFGPFIEKYLAPCVVIFEDIDSFAGSREEQHNPILSDFLQLISGVGDQDNKTIYIATTNHIDHLDKAVADRPMRFNRKFKFEYASDEEINKLIDVYFGKGLVSDEDKALCHGCKFTGAHIKELLRTASVLSLKNKLTKEQNFKEAIDIFRKNFNVKSIGVIGFGVR